jgi:hypothetical protein
MNLKNEFNRLSDYFSTGAEKIQTMTEDFGDQMRNQTSRLGERAVGGLRSSKDSLMSSEELLLQHMRDHQRLYILTALLLLGAIFAKAMLHLDRRPMRQEW